MKHLVIVVYWGLDFSFTMQFTILYIFHIIAAWSIVMRYKVSRVIILFWCFFIGIGAVFGSSCMLIKPDGSILGMDGMLPYFQVLPFAKYLFQNFIFSGFSLLIVNGLSNLIAAILILKNKKIGHILGFVFGITLMLWICIQFVIFPQNILSQSYFVFGLLQFISGYVCFVFYCQKTFAEKHNAQFYQSNYKNIGSDKKTLVVYFSRMGYTKKIAYEKADETGAEILELETTEMTKDTLGFWWCGRFGMHAWGMNLKPYAEEAKLESREKVIIVTPIWVFSICGPVRQFCKENNGKIKRVEYVMNHFNPGSFFGMADEMDKKLGIKHEKLTSICTQLSKRMFIYIENK